MKSDFAIAGLSASPGIVKCGRIPVPNACYPDGAQVDIPVVLINGAHDGPVLYLDAATHGSEVGGVEVIQTVTRERIDPKRLHGAIIAIPVVNIPSFRLCSGFNPHDAENTNRTFPGDPHGTMNQKIAHAVFQITGKADYAINFHAMSQASVALPYTYFFETDNAVTNRQMKNMAEAFGITFGRGPWSGQPCHKGFAPMASAHGLPALLVELPSQYVCGRSEVNVGIRGVLNIMKSLGMLAGRIEKQRECPVIREPFLREACLGSKDSGFLRPKILPGKRVRKGQEIGVLVDVFGNKISSICSPGDGYVIAYSNSFAQPIVKEGGWLATLLVK